MQKSITTHIQSLEGLAIVKDDLTIQFGSILEHGDE